MILVFGVSKDSAETGTHDNPNTAESRPIETDAPALTRRELRERERNAAAPIDADVAVVTDAPAHQVEDSPAIAARTAQPSITPVVRPAGDIATIPAAAFTKKSPRKRSTTARSLATGAVMTLAAGLVATMALPAYAYNQNDGFDANAATAPLTAGEQTVTVAASATAGAVSRDGYKAPTEGELAMARAAAEAAAAAAAAAARPASSGSGSGGSPSFTVNPPSGSYSGEAIVAYADQFVGKVPYGSGASPSTSFGCDGLVQYVFAQFGINLPRGVSAQAGSGVRISPDDVQAGDLVIWPGQHIAIADGRGGYVNAPDWGRYVEHTSNWWGSYYFVRIVR